MATATKKSKSAPVMKSLPASGNGSKSPARGRTDDDGLPPGGENLDKVRDILFGSQMRDSERRLARIEERLVKEVTDVRDETRKRLDSLEAFLRKELATLTDRVKTEQASRNDAVKGVSAEIREAVKGMTEQLRSAEEKTSESLRDVRQEILDQSKAIHDELQRSNSATLAAFTTADDELRDEKADRATLSDLFAEFAERLQGDGRKGK